MMQNQEIVKKTALDRILQATDERVKYQNKVTLIDKFLAGTFLKLVPSFITPNQITIFRFITVPIILYLLYSGDMLYATILFVISAFSDALDGALARTTNHITTTGILIDPLADKLLVGSVSLIMVTVYINVHIALAIVLAEIILLTSSFYRYKGKIVPAKLSGKIKMILQCVGLSILLMFALTGNPVLLTFATYTLYASIVAAIFSLVVYRSI